MAQAVLDEAVKAVIATDTTDMWQKENQPGLVDYQLQQVRGMLEKFGTSAQ